MDSAVCWGGSEKGTKALKKEPEWAGQDPCPAGASRGQIHPRVPHLLSDEKL